MWAAVSASATPAALAVSEPRGIKQQYLFVAVVSGSRGIVPGYLLLVFPVQGAGCYRFRYARRAGAFFTPRRRLRQIRRGSPFSSPDTGPGHRRSVQRLANRGLPVLLSDGSPGLRVLP